MPIQTTSSMPISTSTATSRTYAWQHSSTLVHCDTFDHRLQRRWLIRSPALWCSRGSTKQIYCVLECRVRLLWCTATSSEHHLQCYDLNSKERPHNADSQTFTLASCSSTSDIHDGHSRLQHQTQLAVGLFVFPPRGLHSQTATTIIQHFLPERAENQVKYRRPSFRLRRTAYITFS